jgi:N6-L-threonylcarbamoyladenine synthase
VILALETSCDDTCAAVLSTDEEIASNVISSQGIHDRYGGVVPEIASRHHLELVNDTVADALRQAGATLADADRIAVTRGPGLVGALLVGLQTAKGLAAANGKPLVPVDHLHGHVAANLVGPEPFDPPFLCLIASGGHTLLADVQEPGSFTVLGQTLDDAAGEAFDKGARLLGLGYPGGPALQRLAETGDAHAFDFPTARNVTGLDFSFAGLKTSLLYKVREYEHGLPADNRRALAGQARSRGRLRRLPAADLAASYQRAIVTALTDRIERALQKTGHTRLAIGGGVAANGPLRTAAAGLAPEVHIPPTELCTDNAAMIASAARFVPSLPYPDYLAIDAYATGEAA